MKKIFALFVIILLIFVLQANAQPVQLGAAGITQESELVQTDPLNEKRHYKALTIPMKKGQGVLFIMNQSSFKPHLALAAQTGIIAMGRLNEQGTEARVSYTATADTSFFLILTSFEENKTGKFSYSYRLLDASQMNFNNNISTCSRIAYLFNQWQLDWELIPQYTKTVVDDDDEGMYEFKETNRTLKGGPAILGGGYDEKLYSASADLNGKTREYYDKICSEVKSCLDPALWVFETEQKENKGSSNLSSYTSHITYFTMKGGEKNRKYQSFKIMLNSPYLPGLRNYEVRLVF